MFSKQMLQSAIYSEQLQGIYFVYFPTDLRMLSQFVPRINVEVMLYDVISFQDLYQVAFDFSPHINSWVLNLQVA